MSSPNETPTAKPNWFRVIALGRKPRNTLIRTAILIVLVAIIFGFRILLPIRVEGISMLPTFRDHSLHLINRLAYWHHSPKRGDIVSIRYAGIHYMLLKRVVGLPGETVAFENGRVLIDGKPLDEPYEKEKCDWNMPPEKLSADEYFVVGDNRTMPMELHVFGRTTRERIIGKLLL